MGCIFLVCHQTIGILRASLEQSLQAQISEFKKRLQYEFVRTRQPFSARLIKRVGEARHQRVVRYHKFLDRDRRGDYSPKSYIKRRRGPPAHILSKMSEKTRALDRAARGTSEVGYVALAKTKLGIPLKDPRAWLEEQAKLTTNERRRYEQFRVGKEE